MSKRFKDDKPFVDRTFYLDICNNASIKSKVIFCIKHLGGTVEEFLDKKVRYLITDRPEKDWPIDKRPETERPDGSRARDSKLDLLTLARGKRLACKTPTQQSNGGSKSTDVLETGRKLRMKILSYKSILNFCKQYMKIPNEEQPSDETSQIKINQTTGVKFKTLRAPFIKFEDNEEKYQPSVKELDAWPELDLNTPAGTCPFGNVMFNRSNTRKVSTNTNPTGGTTTASVTPAASGTAHASVTPALSTKLRETTKPVLAQKKRQRVLFCEICCKEFTNMSEHIKTEYHQQYMVNDEHYKELRSVIESLPDWTTLNEAKKCEEEPSDVESEFETEMGSEITDSDDEDGDEEDEEEDEEEEDEAEDVQDEGPCEQIDVVAGERTFEPFSTTNEPNRSKNESKFEHDTSNVLRTNDSLITNDEDTTMMMKSFKFRTDNSNITIDTVQLTSDAKSILTLDVMDTSNLTKSASNPTIAKDDYRAHVSPTGNSVVINLNTELSKAFGEGSLLPLHRHVSQQPDNMTDNRWQHIKIQNETPKKSKSLPSDSKITVDMTGLRNDPLEVNSGTDLVPPSCSSPVQPFRLKHVFADLTNDRHTQSDEF